MKLIRVKSMPGERRVFIFQMGKREKNYFFATLGCYPSLDLEVQPLSRLETPGQDAQKLLDDAMAELRQERQKKLETFMRGTRFTREGSGGLRFSIAAEDVEWLLQVLNEIRVGCWIGLGRPESGEAEYADLEEDQMKCRAAMDLSAHFEMALLEASNAI